MFQAVPKSPESSLVSHGQQVCIWTGKEKEFFKSEGMKRECL
jgi:hypothetical protein